MARQPTETKKGEKMKIRFIGGSMDGKFVDVPKHWRGDFIVPQVFSGYSISPESEVPQSMPVMETRYKYLETFHKEWVFVHPSEIRFIRNGALG